MHESTKYTPYFVVFGRNQVSDGREYARIRENYNSDEKTGDEVKTKREELYEEVRKNLQNAYKRHEKSYNLRSNNSCPRYVAGETVLKKTFDLSDKAKGFCRKLAPKFGPCVIRKVLGSHTYEVENMSGKRIGVFFADQLKKFNPTSSYLNTDMRKRTAM